MRAPATTSPYSNTFAQLFLTAINAGIVRGSLRDASELVRSRKRTFYYAPSEALDAATAALDADTVNAAEAAHKAALFSAKAKIIADEFAIRSGSLLFDVGGDSATNKAANFDRHWRNARTLSSHNPATYKARAIGQYERRRRPRASSRVRSKPLSDG
ncbi:hypothetical protein N2603_39615 [Bradyrhizobium huanghuaihaiense]|uniref:hypothetical protein n=1 Tax=Bradyrhizobium huanghuaihaiense TaxID=990078 RepID=UPI0021AA0314|nr:hypothetical protein N2603_39615 [Bradyrhizobium sp. CB3035]